MASNPKAGFACRSNSNKALGPVSDAGRPRRYVSESEPDLCGTAKSLSRLCSRDEGERAAALEELSQWVRVCLDQPGSARLSKDTLLCLLRLSHSCPLEEVRVKAQKLLHTAQVRTARQCSFALESSSRIESEPVQTH